MDEPPLLYRVSRFAAWCWAKVWLRAAVQGAENVAAAGPVLLVCNHASHLDPLLQGIFTRRYCRYVARSSLGRIPLVGSWMRRVGTVFIDRDAPGRAAVGAIIDLLQQGQCVVMFPEGTRSRDGRLGRFQRGLLLLLKKSDASVVPVGIRGSFAALPPGAILPRPRRVAVHFGPPRPAAAILAPGGLEALREEVAVLSGTAPA